jgi:hypothetical protein
LTTEESALPATQTGVDHDPSVLLGSWQLELWEIAYSDGRPSTLPFGAQATGLIVYTNDGHMSACIARAQRRTLSGQSTRTVPTEEQVAAFESYFHYAGRYHTRQHQGRTQVVHEVSHALNPNFVGSQQIRDMNLDGDNRLILSASDPLPGRPEVMRHHRLIWRRKEAP